MVTENGEKGIVDREIERLAQMRDELRVQAHLLKADTKSELESLEKRFEQLRRDAHASNLRRAAEDSVEEVSDATRLLLDTVRDGFTRIRKSLTSK